MPRFDETAEGFELRRGADPKKDQSYVLSMLGQDQLARVVLPVGQLTKAAVRDHAGRLGLRTADKPDSQDVCFIHGADGRLGFLGRRLALHAADVVDGASGAVVGSVDAVELVTVGQRRGMGHGTDGQRRYVVAVDVPGRRVVVGGPDDAVADDVRLDPRQPDVGGRPAGRRHPGGGPDERPRPAGRLRLRAGRATGRSSGSTSGSARSPRARRSPSTTPATPTRSSGPASPPEMADRGGPGRPTGGPRPGRSSSGS